MENNESKFWLVGAISALLANLGMLATPITLLVIANLLDYITGITSNIVQDKPIQKHKSFIGIVRKVSMYFLIIVGIELDLIVMYVTEYMGIEPVIPNVIAITITVWLILHELLSITENVNTIGIKIPFLSGLIKFIGEKVITLEYKERGEEDEPDKSKKRE